MVDVAHPEWMTIPDDMRAAATQRGIEKAAADKAQRFARAEAEQKRLAETAERLDVWVRNFTTRTDGFYNLPIKLRVQDDEVQTSHGANIPLDHAVKIWPLLNRAHKAGKPIVADPERTIHLGHYKFNSFEDDTLHVGCHHIPYSEIERMAQQLNLLEPAHA